MITLDVLSIALSAWGIHLKHKGGVEYCGPCPFCRQATKDGFLVWAEGNGRFYCRKCNITGFLDDIEGAQKITAEELARMKAEAERRARARAKKEQASRQAMSLCMAQVTAYHKALTPGRVEWWVKKGVSYNSIVDYQLGYCDRCPTDKDGRDSYTIPVWHRGQLLNIRHRIDTTEQGNKYRPHRAHLGHHLFNADLLFDPNPPREILLVEGCIKSIVLMEYGLASIAIMGSNAFKAVWLDWLKDTRVFVALDPDVTRPGIQRRNGNGSKPVVPAAYRLAFLLAGAGIDTRLVSLPAKPDDLFVLYGWNVDHFDPYLRFARKIRPG